MLKGKANQLSHTASLCSMYYGGTAEDVFEVWLPSYWQEGRAQMRMFFCLVS